MDKDGAPIEGVSEHAGRTSLQVDPFLTPLQANTDAFWVDFAHRPDGESGTDDCATWFRSGIFSENYNGVVGTCRDVDGMLAMARGWGLPARWIVSSANALSGFEATLSARGCVLVDESPGMVATIASLPAPGAHDLHLEVVRDRAGFDAWAEVFADAFGLGTDAAARLHQAHAWPWGHNRRRTYLLLHREGLAVATGLLYWRGDVAGVYGIGVRRAFQRRGLGALATLLTAKEGRRLGASVAVLQATAQGFPVYERLGFRTACSFRSWRIT